MSEDDIKTIKELQKEIVGIRAELKEMSEEMEYVRDKTGV